MFCGHGNDKYKVSGKIIADFSSNVWYKPMPEWFYSSLGNFLRNTTDYPHPAAFDLVEVLSHHFKLPTQNILATNGSVEGIFLLAQAFIAKKTALIIPSFSEYEDACKRYNHQLKFYENKPGWHKVKYPGDIIFFGNPNNPEGKWLSLKQVEELLIAHPNSTVIIDEAFSGLCNGFQSAIPLLEKYSNLVVLKSFTKTFAIPGIRLGCVMSSEQIIGQLRQFTIPWSVNSVAIEAGKLIVDNYQKLVPGKEEQIKGNRYLHSELSTLPELDIWPSDCNFILVKMKKGNAAGLKSYLAEKHRLLIRDASNFRGLSENHFRVSVQACEHINLLVRGIRCYFEPNSF